MIEHSVNLNLMLLHEIKSFLVSQNITFPLHYNSSKTTYVGMQLLPKDTLDTFYIGLWSFAVQHLECLDIFCRQEVLQGAKVLTYLQENT
jgi:hypothetical protein